MNRNTRFAIVTIILSLILLPIGVSTAYEQRVPTDSGTGRPDSTPIPHRMDATQGPTDGHLGGTRQAQPPGDTRQIHKTGDVVHPQNRSSEAARRSALLKEKVTALPQKGNAEEKAILKGGSANLKGNTPCRSPKCLGAVSTKPSVDVFRSQVGDGAQGLKSIQGSRSLGAVQGRRR